MDIVAGDTGAPAHLIISGGSKMSRPPSCQSTPQFYRISDKDLTEIELHSVDSINDLHRMHEHSHKGTHPHPKEMDTQSFLQDKPYFLSHKFIWHVMTTVNVSFVFAFPLYFVHTVIQE